MERDRAKNTALDRDRTPDRDRWSDRDRMSDQEREEMARRYDEERGTGTLARRDYRDYGSSSMLGRDPRVSPGFEMMRQMMREMARPFGDFFGHGSSSMGTPPVEVFERNDRLVVRADLPGMRREDVKVRVVDDALIIEGERRSERERDPSRREGYYESEFTYGRFSRRIVLPGRIDAHRVRARFENGVLEVEVRCETPASRDVPIEVDREVAGTGERGR